MVLPSSARSQGKLGNLVFPLRSKIPKSKRQVDFIFVATIVALVILPAGNFLVRLQRSALSYRGNEQQHGSVNLPTNQKSNTSDGTRSTKQQLGSNHDALSRPLVLISSSCSKSSFVVDFAQRLIKLHTGREAVLIKTTVHGHYFRGAEYLDKDKSPLYNKTLAKTDEILAQKKMVFDTQRVLVKSSDPPYIMAPKMFADHLKPGTAAALRELGARVVVTYRENKLEQTVCRIRDCFVQAPHGHPVNAVGGKSNLCFQRRRSTAVSLAQINATHLDSEMKRRMERFGCHEGLQSPEHHDLIQKRLLLKLSEYPELASESLSAFEYFKENSLEFNKSLEDWKALLGGWGIAPVESLILQEMHKQGIGGRTKTSIKGNVYNFDQVNAVLEGWAKKSKVDAKICDWSWMASL